MKRVTIQALKAMALTSLAAGCMTEDSTDQSVQVKREGSDQNTDRPSLTVTDGETILTVGGCETCFAECCSYTGTSPTLCSDGPIVFCQCGGPGEYCWSGRPFVVGGDVRAAAVARRNDWI